MRDTVRLAFYAFNAPYEGEVPWLYQDVKGLVSIGVGLLCDPIQLALNLPMVHADGTAAGRDEIAAEWLRIKNLPPDSRGRTAAQLGHLYAKPHTRLRLTEAGLRETLWRKLSQMDAFLAKRFPAYEEWPADAQLGTLSMAWACGPAFRFPRFDAAVRRLDFAEAAAECHMDLYAGGVYNAGLAPRNDANRRLFLNADFVQIHGLDPDVLHWPRDASEDDGEPTQPEIRLDRLDSDGPPPPDFPIVHPSVFREPGDDEPPDEAA